MNLTDLPSEILCDIFKQFDSLYTFKALSQTCSIFKNILSELLLVICDDENDLSIQKPSHLENLVHINISKISIHSLAALMRKFHYFIFNFSCTNTSSLLNQIKILKIVLRNLQLSKLYHTVYINSKNFNMDPLIRFLLPKLNSPFTEFYFPFVRKIEGFEDLRLLDNTNCYFSQLEVLIIGSLSFQLFNLKAPKLKVFNHSKVILDRTAFNENVSTARISYSKFLNNLMCSDLECLEVIGAVAHSTLYKFNSVKILRIYADNSSESFNLKEHNCLEELVISKCSKLRNIEGLHCNNQTLRSLDLSNNKKFDQDISGFFNNMEAVNLSNTDIKKYPNLKTSGNHLIVVNVEGCKNLNIKTA